MFEFIKKIYKEFFYMPKHGEPHAHAVLTRLSASVTVLALVLSVWGYATVAFFSDSVSTTLAHISAAHFNVTVTDADGNPVSDSIVANYDGKGVKREFEISATGTASSGFCVIRVGDLEFETEKINNGDTLTVSVFAANDAEISFEAHWGEPTSPVETVEAVTLAPTMFSADERELFIYHQVGAGESVDNIAYKYNVEPDVVRYMYSVVWGEEFDPEIEFGEFEELLIPVDPAGYEDLISAEYQRIEEERLAEEAAEQERIASEQAAQEQENLDEIEPETEENLNDLDENSAGNESLSEPDTENNEEIKSVVLSDETIPEFADAIIDIIEKNMSEIEENPDENEEPITYEYDFMVENDLVDGDSYFEDGDVLDIVAPEGNHEFRFFAAPDMAEGYVRIVFANEFEFYTAPILPTSELLLEIETPENAELFFEFYAQPLDFEPNDGVYGDDLNDDSDAAPSLIVYDLYVEAPQIEDETDENEQIEADSEPSEEDNSSETEENPEISDEEIDSEENSEEKNDNMPSDSEENTDSDNKTTENSDENSENNGDKLPDESEDLTSEDSVDENTTENSENTEIDSEIKDEIIENDNCQNNSENSESENDTVDSTEVGDNSQPEEEISEEKNEEDSEMVQNSEDLTSETDDNLDDSASSENEPSDFDSEVITENDKTESEVVEEKDENSDSELSK